MKNKKIERKKKERGWRDCWSDTNWWLVLAQKRNGTKRKGGREEGEKGDMFIQKKKKMD